MDDKILPGMKKADKH